MLFKILKLYNFAEHHSLRHWDETLFLICICSMWFSFDSRRVATVVWLSHKYPSQLFSFIAIKGWKAVIVSLLIQWGNPTLQERNFSTLIPVWLFIYVYVGVKNIILCNFSGIRKFFYLWIRNFFNQLSLEYAFLENPSFSFDHLSSAVIFEITVIMYILDIASSNKRLKKLSCMVLIDFTLRFFSYPNRVLFATKYSDTKVCRSLELICICWPGKLT